MSHVLIFSSCSPRRRQQCGATHCLTFFSESLGSVSEVRAAPFHYLFCLNLKMKKQVDKSAGDIVVSHKRVRGHASMLSIFYRFQGTFYLGRLHDLVS